MKILLIGLIFLCGCASMPGTISQSVSGFDKTKEINMQAAFVGNNLSGGNIKLGLYNTSKMDPDKAILTAFVNGAYNFADSGSLQFNIDGKIVVLNSIDVLTEIQTDPGVNNSVAYIAPENWSSKRYEVSKGLIKQLIEGKEVWLKINLSKEYVEAEFSKDTPMDAKTGFRNFYKIVWLNDNK